jgi:hypothetical protein
MEVIWNDVSRLICSVCRTNRSQSAGSDDVLQSDLVASGDLRVGDVPLSTAAVAKAPLSVGK